MEECYRRALRRDPLIDGSITAQLSVASDGHVTFVRIETGVEPHGDACVAEELGRVWFGDNHSAESVRAVLLFDDSLPHSLPASPPRDFD
jgi:hypothetical protein